MTRAEAEKRIMNHVKEIALIMKEYNTESNYLNASINVKDNYGAFNNQYYDKESVDYNMPLYQHTFNLLEDIDD